MSELATSTALTTYSNQYMAKKALFSFLGATFRIYGTDGSLQFYIKQKAFKMKEEINVFEDEGQTKKRLTIKARSWGDFSGAYDVIDANTDEIVGVARRSGFKSIFKDEWVLGDKDGNEVGKVAETGGIFAVLRRFIKLLKMIPQKYEVTVGGELEGTIKQRFNPFQLAYDVDFAPGSGKLDPRFGIGITVLILAIEGARD